MTSVGIVLSLNERALGAGQVGIAALDIDEAPVYVGGDVTLPTARVPHIAWPMSLPSGRLATVEQDSIADVTQCVNVLLHTARGARVLLPDFGIDDPTFTEGLDVDDVIEQAAEYEERAVVTVVELDDTDTGTSTTRLEIDLAT